MVELYTKRDFHCDCGVKPGSVTCNLDPFKSVQKSQKNKYNQNFAGLYCTCHRPYPDPECTNNDVMIQCVVCEDWYHSLHLDGVVPTASAYDEMICGACMTKVDFLNDYSGLSINVIEAEVSKNESSLLNVSSLDESTASKVGDGEVPDSKKIKLSEEDACVRPKLELTKSEQINASFWKKDWRQKLCKCMSCLRTYKDAAVEFLVDLEDTTHFYEEKGKTKDLPTFEAESLQALNSLPRVNQIDAITGYNRMKDKLFEFLQVL
jgi:E3 ubiquitin-protein ligase UBR7